MRINKSKFQTAVHLGLLVIIFVLLLMNFRSNLTIYHAGAAERKTTIVELNKAAISVGRVVQKDNLSRFSAGQEKAYEEKYGLNDLILLTDDSSVNPSETLDRLLVKAVSAVRASGTTSGIDQLKRSDIRQLVKGHGSLYYYLVPLNAGNRLLILSKRAPDLAYLEESSETLILVNIVVVLVIVVVYLFVFRLILSPFRKIKRQALSAGRELAGGSDEVEALVDDYRQIVTELKEKENQLLELNKTIQARADRLELFNQYLLRSMSSGIIIVDACGRIMSVNKAAGQIIGVDTENCAGKRYDELPTFCVGIFETVNTMLETDRSQSYREYDITSPDGRDLSLGVTVSSIHDYTSSRVGVSILVNDLTEIRSLRSEIEGRNRLAALGEMAGGLAHQLRNSIGAMSGYSHLVKKRLLKNNLSTDSIVALEDEAKEAETLVDRFLSFARPFNFTAENTNITGMIDDLLETFRVRPENKHIEFQVENDLPGRMCAEIDSLLCKQALANIIENAINAYEGSKGTVRVGLSAHSGILIVQIQDSGCGISDDNLDKIFTPFFSSRPSGTGLGLPLAKKIVDLHNGRLVVKSGPGEGTTFTVFLPTDDSVESSPRAETVLDKA